MIQEITAIETKKDIQYLNNGLVLPDDLTRQEWDGVWTFVMTANTASQWWVGDCLNYAERRYGETYTQALTETDYTYQSLVHCKYVANVIQLGRRRPNLSWSHHLEVASLAPQQQDYWLDIAEKTSLTSRELRVAVKGGIKQLTATADGDFSWFKDQEYKRAQEVLKPEYRHYLDRLNDKDETSTATQYVAHMEYRWMMERCTEIERKWGQPE